MSQDPQASVELITETHVTDAQRKRGMFFLGLVVAAFSFAVTLQLGLGSNFMVEEMKLTGFQQGQLEAFREVCGVTALVLLALMAGLAEPLVGAAMLVLFGVGLAGYAIVPDYFWLIVASLIWSQGLHVWMPLPNSMAMALAEPGRVGHRLGQIRAAGAIGAAVGILAAMGLNYLGSPIRLLYVIAGAVAIVAAAGCLGIPRDIKTPGPRIVLRKKYGLYYLLSFLEGWRKQIFAAFAGFLLVKVHGAPLSTMLLLWLGIQIIGWAASPMVGRLIDRVGERRVLVFYFGSLTIFFVGYALIRDVRALYALYVIDSAMFVFAMALTTYVNRIAPKSEHTPTLSMGVAMNHVAAVIMPLAGGLLWKFAGYQWVFLAGAAGAAVSAIVSLWVPSHSERA